MDRLSFLYNAIAEFKDKQLTREQLKEVKKELMSQYQNEKDFYRDLEMLENMFKYAHSLKESDEA